jgi:DNA-binding transcriptional MerR regulator
MNVRILTLFDDEPILPPIPAVKKKRAPKALKAIEAEQIDDVSKSNDKTQSVKVKKFAPSINTNIAEKNYYSIGETANMFKVRTSHIRFWTVQFAIKVRTTRKGDRLYTPENIELLRVIHHLVKVQGYTIAGAKSKLKDLKNIHLEDLYKSNIIEYLNSIKATLISLRNQI